MDASAFPRQFADTRRFSLGVPRSFSVSPDGERVLFVRTGGGDDPVSRLWLLEHGTERVLADPAVLNRDGAVPEAERVRRERAREISEGVVGYATDRHARVVAFSLGGALWVVGTGVGERPRRVPTAGPVVDPRPSPDGRFVAYVCQGAMRVVRIDGDRAATDGPAAESGPSAESGQADVLLAGPESPEVTYGLADHVAAESMGRHRGYWWSPDGTALLVARVDTAPVRRWYLADPARPERPPREVPYPAAGTANSVTELHVLRLDGTRTPVRTPTEAPAGPHPAGAWTDRSLEYVSGAAWDAHGPLAALQSRDQRAECLYTVDPASGESRLLDHRTDAPWAEILPGTPLRTASGTPVLAAVADDTCALRVGTAVTPPGLQVREVLGAAGERVLFTASEEPTEVHVWQFEPGAGCTRLSSGPGVHTATANGPTLVLDSRTDDGHTVTVLRDGRPAGQIGVRAQEPLVRPAPTLLRLGQRALRSALFLPSGHTPGDGRLPVLVNSYSGPGVQMVLRARGWWSAVSQWFADQGFAVLTVDGRGTPGRGHAWEKSVHGDQLAPVLEDQVDAVRAAVRERAGRDLDLDRVAIRGWSFGGFLAAGAVLHRPDVFHAAVAGAAPTDLRLYDTHWKERYLGHPDVTPEAYDRCDLVAGADRLTRPLLLVHGVADDNVVLAHMLRFSAALLAAGRPHSVLPLSGATHLPTGRGTMDALLTHELGFLRQALGARPVAGF